jgi:hypothetical protein
MENFLMLLSAARLDEKLTPHVNLREQPPQQLPLPTALKTQGERDHETFFGSLAIGALLAASPALAGGSMENPSDKKAPEANKTGSDNPANAGEGPAKPAGEGAPLPQGASEGSSSGSSGSSSPDSSSSGSSNANK